MIIKYCRVPAMLVLVLLLGYRINAQDTCGTACTCGKNDIAPAGIIMSQVHEKGKWMISYQYMRDAMAGNMLADKNISDETISNTYGYLMAPARMHMDMHMLMLMYGINDKLTLMLMTSWNVAAMNMNGTDSMNASAMPGMIMDAKIPERQQVSGFGDVKLYALYRLAGTDDHEITAALGVNIPTGSVNIKAFPDVYPGLNADYNMQTGSGAVEFMPGLSYVKHDEMLDWGVQVSGTLRPFFNNNGYHYGNEGVANIWAARKWNAWLSSSLRASAVATGSMAGRDPDQFDIMEPASNAVNYGGFKAFIYPGINVYSGMFLSKEIKFRFEYGIPFYQYAVGVQMRSVSRFLAGIDVIL
jgi:hypothetical protein